MPEVLVVRWKKLTNQDLKRNVKDQLKNKAKIHIILKVKKKLLPLKMFLWWSVKKKHT